MSDMWKSIRDGFNDVPTWGKAAIGVTVVGVSSYFILGSSIFKKKRKSPFKTDFKPGVVYVYQFPRAAVIPNISPYCLKLETWLRMADIEYENANTPMWLRSKEGTIPFVELNGVEYCDSSFIIRDLIPILKKDSVDGWLSDEQKAASRAFQQMVENTTLMSQAYLRYLEHLDELLSDKIGFPIPGWWKLVMPMWLLKKEFRKKLYYHGIGRHSREEAIRIGLDDMRSISAYLGSKDYFHGDAPTTVDAFLFAVLAQVLYVPIHTPHLQMLNAECTNLVRYCDRIKSRFWPDWDVILRTGSMNTWKK